VPRAAENLSATDRGIMRVRERCREAVYCHARALDQAQLPNHVATLKALLIAADGRVSALDAGISNLKLTIAKLLRAEFSASRRLWSMSQGPSDPKFIAAADVSSPLESDSHRVPRIGWITHLFEKLAQPSES
jgi:hypothetical protein